MHTDVVFLESQIIPGFLSSSLNVIYDVFEHALSMTELRVCSQLHFAVKMKHMRR